MSHLEIFSGRHIAIHLDAAGVATLTLDHGRASVNKFDREVLAELGAATAALVARSDICGLVITSAKDVFVVGADIMEFKGYFAAGAEALASWLAEVHQTFNRIEDLPYPTVTAIDGVCLGGGMEFALTTTFRVVTPRARLGLPETKLGICPGWGGTVRLPRLIGADQAIEWISSGSTYRPGVALQVGVVDAVVESEHLVEAAHRLVRQAAGEQMDWRERQRQKKAPLQLISPLESALVFEGAKAFVAGKAGPHYPAPVASIVAMQQASTLERDPACTVEIETFVRLACSQVANNLVTVFLNDQYNKKQSKKYSQDAQPCSAMGVVGAGIMGGGIAYQSASRRIRAVMKDLAPAALQLGMQEAAKLFAGQAKRGKIDTQTMLRDMAAITPVLGYEEMKGLPLVIEAVVENVAVKKKVLAELEEVLAPDAVMASNTSTISIDALAEGMEHPERFCGIHFFNPVHRMPLVEIIRGKKTSPQTLAVAVGYALQLGKTPVVVGDGPGFLVNRVLFPYLLALEPLLSEGAGFEQIDRIMERFGWPMGPAYLIDVIGIDTCVHAARVMASGFPERMQVPTGSVMVKLFEAGRLGQKNGKGFYAYTPDRKGKPRKSSDPSVQGLLPAGARGASLDADEVTERFMLPCIFESVRCLEDGIVASPMEADLAMLYGIGFPPFRGGVFKYADDCGLAHLVARGEAWRHLGAAYEPPALLRRLAASGKTFYTDAP